MLHVRDSPSMMAMESTLKLAESAQMLGATPQTESSAPQQGCRDRPHVVTLIATEKTRASHAAASLTASARCAIHSVRVLVACDRLARVQSSQFL